MLLTLVLIVSLVVPFASLDHKVISLSVFAGKVTACPVVGLVAGALRGVGPEQQLAAALDALALQAEGGAHVEGHLGPEGDQQDDDHQQDGAQAGGAHIEYATFA